MNSIGAASSPMVTVKVLVPKRSVSPGGPATVRVYVPCWSPSISYPPWAASVGVTTWQVLAAAVQAPGSVGLVMVTVGLGTVPPALLETTPKSSSSAGRRSRGAKATPPRGTDTETVEVWKPFSMAVTSWMPGSTPLIS